MLGRKKIVADRFATSIYSLWMEEEIANGNLPLPRGRGRDWFYEPLVRDALCMCDWIGAARGQIDEKKETEAAIMRIEAGLSTLEIECARLGHDYRDLIVQRAREKRMLDKHGLTQVVISATGAQQADDEQTDEEPTDDE
jgi:capsid protein